MPNKLDYLHECWEEAQSHWLAVVVSFGAFVYSFFTTWSNVEFSERWPKLPFPWAVVVLFASVLWIVIEGGHRIRQKDAQKAHEQIAKEQEKLAAEIKLRERPQIAMEWSSGKPDFLTLHNIGGIAALNVKVGELSWPELHWFQPIEIQLIHAQRSTAKMEARVYKGGYPQRQEIASLYDFLESPEFTGRELFLTVSFSDHFKTQAMQEFLLHAGGNRQITAKIRELQIT